MNFVRKTELLFPKVQYETKRENLKRICHRKKCYHKMRDNF